MTGAADPDAPERSDWRTENAQHLAQSVEAALAALRSALAPLDPTSRSLAEERSREIAELDIQIPGGSALDRVARACGLDPAERRLLSVLIAFELDGRPASIIGADRPSIGLLMRAIPELRWEHMRAEASLRQLGCITVEPEAPLVMARISIAPEVVEIVAGNPPPQPRDPITVVGPSEIAPTQRASLSAVIDQCRASMRLGPVTVMLSGADRVHRRMAATALANELQLNLHAVHLDDLPRDPALLTALLSDWGLVARIAGDALVVDATTDRVGDRDAILRRVAATPSPLLIVVADEPVDCSDSARTVVPANVDMPTTTERRVLWGGLLETLHRNLEVEPAETVEVATELLAVYGPASLARVEEIATESAAELGAASSTDSDTIVATVRSVIAQRSAPRLGAVADRVTVAPNDQVVLPATPAGQLDDFVDHIRWSAAVREEAALAGADQSIAALFAGPSGTGKTQAARAIAARTGLDLYRIDLSQVMSKYIGETEKNLRQVFETAATGGAMLLFDEADALFSQRSEVRDSHDRFANVQTAFLLQEIEATKTPCILTTNMKDSIDPAFLRRLRFVVDVPFPDQAGRAQIWALFLRGQRVSPEVEFDKLAQLAVNGATIKNIVLRAYVLGRARQETVSMALLLEASRRELLKVGREFAAKDYANWVSPSTPMVRNSGT